MNKSMLCLAVGTGIWLSACDRPDDPSRPRTPEKGVPGPAPVPERDVPSPQLPEKGIITPSPVPAPAPR